MDRGTPTAEAEAEAAARRHDAGTAAAACRRPWCRCRRRRHVGRLVQPAQAATAPKIAIVGAGLAGLSAAHALKRAGYAADVYEASDRVGGRCWTIRGVFAEGQIAEHGGELIDQGHTAIRQLAQGLGLQLDNLLAAEANGTELLGYFDNAPLPRGGGDP